MDLAGEAPGTGGLRAAAGLAVVAFLAAAALSVKAAADVLLSARSFPAWFAPAFAAGLLVLVAVSGYAVVLVWRARRSARPATGRRAAVVWLLLTASFVCTSAVHQLYPFRPAPLSAYLAAGPVLRWNLVLTLLGFLVTAALGLVYRAGRREAALTALMAFALVLLVPNDDCRNPFNEWWLATVGASPLMFVPNLYASLFALAALAGVHPRASTAALGATCVAVALLGLGHMTRVIW